MMVRRLPRPGFLRVFIAAACCLLALTGCGTTISDKDVDKHQVSVGEVKRLLDLQNKKGKESVILLIDPRPEAEFQKAHIPGARNLQLAQIKTKEKRRDLEGYKNLIVYGNDPASASARAMVKRLMTNEYENVALMAGGLYQWRVTGGTLEGSEVR
jgi:rhodanese-related sulfurtransferase